MFTRQHRLFLVGIFVLGAALPSAVAEDWPAWRGPTGDGHSRESALPTKWDKGSIIWKAALPGVGQSSPAIWGERIYLTTALEKGATRVVLCLDRGTGKVIWQHEAWKGTPELSHQMNGWASATCATDGERVVAFFGKGGMHCYSMDGKQLWSRDLGPFEGKWGTSACPIIVGDLVIQNCDSTADCYIVGLDRKTGKTVWKTPRLAPEKGGWSSPVLVQAGERKEVVVNGEASVKAYDPLTGKELWSCKAFNGRGEPTVTPDKDRVVVVNGLAGDIYAVKTGGTGDVTKSRMAWHTPRKGGRDQPSPIIVGKYVIVANMVGLTTCYDNETGKEIWKERISSSSDQFTASPIAAGGLVYFLSESGRTIVLQPGPALKILADNSLGTNKSELFRASLAASNGQLFARSHTHLYCIGTRK